jgi:hypothetical protein
MTLRLVSHPLPVAWDSREVKWSRWERPAPVTICGPGVKPSRCDCGSERDPFVAVGLRAADAGPGRFARRHALRDLHAFRCPDCGQVEVWDMASGEWWTLDDGDYGLEGSTPPPEWSGGLLDLLNGSTDPSPDHEIGGAE